MTKLERAYRRYRAKYFKRRLPIKPKLCWENMSFLGYCDGEKIAIARAYRKDDTIWKATLLHEMAHLALWPSKTHGRAFQKEMLRLAKLGAFRQLW